MSDGSDSAPAPVDFGEDGKPNAIHAAFAQLDDLVEASVRADLEIKNLETKLEEAKARAKTLIEDQIPELMASMRITKVATTSGRNVEIKRAVRCTIPNADKDLVKHTEAIKWLVDNGQSGLIKNLVSVKLERGSETKAKEIERELLARGYHPDVKQWVEPSTLTKFVKEMLDQSREIPRDTFSIFDQKVAKIS